MSNNDNPRPSSSTGSSLPTAARGGPAVQRKGVKRAAVSPINAIANGNVLSWEEKSSDYLCSICFEIFREAHITNCGHTYCYECIQAFLAISSKCPKCGVEVSREKIIPNHVITQLVAKQSVSNGIKNEIAEASQAVGKVVADTDVQTFFAKKYNDLSLGEVDLLLTMLQRKKEILLTESVEHQRALSIDFLTQLVKMKACSKQRIDREVSLIEMDLTTMKKSPPVIYTNPTGILDSHVQLAPFISSAARAQPTDLGFNITTAAPQPGFEEPSLAARKQRMFSHFDELVGTYLTIRKAELFVPAEEISHNTRREMLSLQDDSLNEFGRTLSHVSRFHDFKVLATLSYSADLITSSNIVSSIEFDKDNEFFAIAGVTRKIKLFEYANVIGSGVDIHCPSAELSCGAKISCVSFSGYYKNRLASSDYDGKVNIWDSSSTAKIRSLNEHEKRVWSVDWSGGDPRLLASGSDDAKVKLWSTNQERSVTSLEAKANVCCVKFVPESSYLIAFGSADHCIHYYDFRQIREPLGVLKGHNKAVSYVKFASKTELISASTDSCLKLWNVETMKGVRSFVGHTNEKNFVGLATDGNFLACGSENNSLYVYYKSITKPLFSFRFDNHQSMMDKPRVDDSSEFVSAVAWKRGSPVVVAANSQGAIKVLELI